MQNIAESPPMDQGQAFMAASIVQTRLTFWFWLSVVALVCAAVAPLVEWVILQARPSQWGPANGGR
jgi:hypothetical protein